MENDAPHPNPPEQPAAPARGNKVIQPVSDMSEYANSHPAQPSTEGAPQGSADLSKIYPTASAGRSAQPLAAPPRGENKPQPAGARPRVAAVVPSLQVYAILVIIAAVISAISLVALSLLVQVLGGSNVSTGENVLLNSLFFAAASIPLATGIYLLVARSFKVVSIMLLVLLILSGLSLAGTIINTLRFIQSITLFSLTYLAISIGFFIFLWHVKSQVELARLEREQ